MDHVLEAIVKGLIQHLDWNDEIEENFQKIIQMKIGQILQILRQKGYEGDHLAIQEKMQGIAKRYLYEDLLKKMSAQVDDFMNFSLWKAYGFSGVIRVNYSTYFKQYLTDCLVNSKIRKVYYNIYLFLTGDFIERYVKSLYYRKGYGNLSLFAKPLNTPELLDEFLKLTAFFYPVALEGIEVDGSRYFLEEHLNSRENFQKFCKFFDKYILSRFDRIPEAVYQTGLEATINKNQLNYELGQNIRADLLRALFFLSKFRQQGSSAGNKRADTPEKSLFFIFQKQTEFLGLEKNLLYELEFVARENKW